MRNKTVVNTAPAIASFHAITASGNTLNDWDISYYRKKLLDTKYQLNTDEVKQYFEMNNTLKGMFKVYEQLFSIRILCKCVDKFTIVIGDG
ncbi:MAG: hypothetical protein EOO00_14415 [Chitinophagaceae bacterium]|nr:MAG: hypothetical protein EOO00_14415 [Chitinophagaceae bacterium]